MRTLLLAVMIGGAWLNWSGQSWAVDDLKPPAVDTTLVVPPPTPPRPPVEPPVPSREPNEKWNVRVEVMMVSMPQEKALVLLPELRSPEKIDGAVDKIIAAIEKKEAVLTGWPMVVTLSDQRAQSESIDEKRYPVEFDPSAPAPKPPQANSFVDGNLVPSPTSFETRNSGATLEVEPHVVGEGEWIRLDLVPQRVWMDGFEDFPSVNKDGKPLAVSQPQFKTNKIQTSLMVRSGQKQLLCLHLLTKPEGHLEFFIVQAVATPVK